MNHDTIYFDNAATTQPFKAAIARACELMEMYWYNPSASYTPAQEAKEAIEKSRADIAGCLNVPPNTIFFTSGSTEGSNLVIESNLKRLDGGLICSAIEHHAVLNYAGEKVDVEEPVYPHIIDVDRSGLVKMADLDAKVYWRPRSLVAIQACNNEVGTIQPIKEIAALAHRCGHYFFSDITQAIGHFPIDMEDLDYAVCSGHKFGTPFKNVGFVYAREPDTLRPQLRGGAQENGIRPGTYNAAGIVSMAEALRDCYEHMDERRAYIKQLRDYFVNELIHLGPWITFNTPLENSWVGNLNVCFHGIRSEELLEFLNVNHIYASAGSACNTGERSYVLKAIGLSDEDTDSSIRFSLGHQNTIDEVQTVVSTIEAFKKLIGEE